MKQAFVLLFTVLLAVSARPQVTPTAQTSSLVFTNLTVIDMTGAKPKSGLSVLITGNRIAAIGKANKIKIPKDAQIIDASGKYLIPGLWDMHAHTLTDGSSYELVFALLVANGVTGVRDLGNILPFERINQIRREILDGKLLGPRLGATTARILDGKGPGPPPRIEVETAEQARSLVREYKRQGMDFIKPYNLLSRELYLVILDEAKQQKIAVAGHVPLSMTATEVSDLGQISLEHFNDIFLSCSRDEDALRQERKQRQEAAKTGQVRPPDYAGRSLEVVAIETYDERKAKVLAKRFARNGTWWSPTIFIGGTHPAERLREGDNRLNYIPTPIQERWRNDVKQRPGAVPSADERKIRERIKLEIIGLMHRAGVRLLAGTDIGNPYLYPGFSLHDELGLFVQAGLTPLAALQTATVNPAKFLGKEKELGTIENGKFADLVLLEANPLENIKNTTKISAVVANGRYFPKQDLQKILDDVEKLNNPTTELINKQSSLFDFLNPASTMPPHICY